jgi:hypothetical protein
MPSPWVRGDTCRAWYERSDTFWLGTARYGADGHWFFRPDDQPDVWWKVRADDPRLTLLR